MLIARSLSWTIAFTLTALPCLAGDGARSAPEKKGDSKARVECSCEACTLSRADVATLCAKLASGELPAQYCEGTPPEYVASLKEDPVQFYAQAFMQRSSDVPAALDAVAARFAAADATAEQRTRLLDFACSFPKLADERVAAAMWKSSKASFATDHLVALAAPSLEAPAEIEKELEQRASKDVLAAAALALKGDARGKTYLANVAKRIDPKAKTLKYPALAALGLAALGDEAALAAFRKDAHATVLAALDARDFERARTLAIEADLVARLAKKGEHAQLGWFDARVEAMTKKLAPRLDTSDALFKFLEAIPT